MIFAGAVLLAVLLDQLVGDPLGRRHPVVLIGWLGSRAEALFRLLFSRTRLAGCASVALVLSGTTALSVLPLVVLYRIAPHLADLAAIILLSTCLACRSLDEHARAVHAALVDHPGELAEARERVGMIVGRETAAMDEGAVIRACVESVAENMSDGVIAPLFWAAVSAAVTVEVAPEMTLAGGAVGALLYKAVNTMDSMFGYKDDRYVEFGCCAARLDDLINLVPARLSGLLLVAVAAFVGRGSAAWRTLVRDHRAHASPNAGYPEAAMAGALGIELGGPAVYFGRVFEKPTLGTAEQPPAPGHILKACQYMRCGSLWFSAVLAGVFFLAALWGA
ncbi:MAG: cobalamin biosynthesis protein CobD [Desulfobulbus propionicus]|nr:MAG: cobalamin biosynthesis protein CobD [Desulfobulbus propionicus]